MPKNKLEAAMQSFFEKNCHRILNSEEEKNKFVDDMFVMSQHVHREHSRCKPFELSNGKHRDANKNLYLTVYIPGGNFNIIPENLRYGH